MDAVVERLRHEISERNTVRLAVLFGSFARADAQHDSDVDIVVDGAVDTLSLGTELALACGREVDVVQMRDVTYALSLELMRDGVLLYERAPGAYALWRSRCFATLDMDRPLFERMRNAWLRKLATPSR